MRAPAWLRPDARITGAALCAAGLALVSLPWLLAAALGVESLAAAFWFWGRAAEDAVAWRPQERAVGMTAGYRFLRA